MKAPRNLKDLNLDGSGTAIKPTTKSDELEAMTSDCSSECTDDVPSPNSADKVGTQELNRRLYSSVKVPNTPKNHHRFSSQPEPLAKAAEFISNKFPVPKPLPIQRNRPFRILAIDGGGVRGILPAAILRQLEAESGKPISEMFDLIAGTSTGAILGAMLALPKDRGSSLPKFSATDGVELYLERSREIFQTTLMRRIKTLSGLASAQYSGTRKRRMIEQYVGDARISDLLVDMLVPSFDIREGKPYFFKSSKARRDPRRDYRLVDVLDATSSAPTYFAPVKVEGYDAPKEFGYRSFVDGALTANSPALCALAEAYRNYGADPSNTILVSLGCGASSVGVDHESARRWGGLSWAPFFPNVMLSSSVNTVHYQLAHVVPPKHYFRVQTNLPTLRADIDNVTRSNLSWLDDYGTSVATACRPQLNQLAILLEQLSPKHGRRYPTLNPIDTPNSGMVSPAGGDYLNH
ncbi:hypothetical protein L0F63_006076 [Massospora cicadina]|nr:hypothetical protein L0F63_006076 [Massospora cicadina]